MYFDRFDICCAYNLYSQFWGHDKYTHGIQNRLSKLEFKPAPSEEFLEGLSENAFEIYVALVQKREGEENAKRESWLYLYRTKKV